MPVLAAMIRKLSSSTGTALSSSRRCAPARRTPATTRFLPPFIASRFSHRMHRKPLQDKRASERVLSCDSASEARRCDARERHEVHERLFAVSHALVACAWS